MCTILFNIFISLLYTFRASMRPSSGENYCIYVTLVFVTLYVWRLVCWLDMCPSSGENYCIYVTLVFVTLYMWRLVCWLDMCPSSGKNYCIYATLVFVTLYGWRLVYWLDFDPTRKPDATHTEWQIPVSHWYNNFHLTMDTRMPETCREEK